MIRKKNNKSGAILLTVIILSMLLSVVVITIMSTNVGQIKTSQTIIDETKAEYLGQAYFYKYHQDMATGGAASTTNITGIIIDNKPFSADFDENPGTYQTTTISIIISHP